MKRLFTLLLISFTALSCEMIDEKIDDQLENKNVVIFAEGTELSVDVPSKQTVLNYKFESTLDWEVKTEAEWLEIDPMSGKAGKDIKIQIKVLHNKDKEGRTGYADLTLSNDESYRITINQAGEGDENEDVVVDIPHNQIWYTSVNGEIVEPNDTTAFNVSIISNSYKNGKGVITFDGIVSIIGDYAFYGCNFESITMPASVTYCGYYAFGACYNLQKVHITDLSAWCNIDFKHDANPLNGSDIYIGENRIVDLVIPSDVTKIKANTFGGCRSIESVSIHSGIEIIESQAFIACSNLKRFYSEPEFGDGLSLIINGRLVSYALNCGVSEYTIPEGVIYIDDSAFAVCYTLNKITIPESVQNIAQSAFAWCGNLSEVYCMAQTPPTAVWEKTPDDALSEYWNAFNSTSSDIKIYVPLKSVETYKKASGWSEYAQYIVGYDF